jgi:large subunit ribosomal protein L10
MNRDQKAAVVDQVATQIEESDAVLAVDYRGLSVTQAVELRQRLGDAGTSFRVVKNRLTSRAADKAGAESLKEFLDGPTAFAFVRGDAALAAKAIATFRREQGLLGFKGGTLEGSPVSIDQIESIARLPAREALQGQFVGVLASPITGLARGLGSLIQGLALQLGQLQEQGIVGGDGADIEATAASTPGSQEEPASTPNEESATEGESAPEDEGGDPAEAPGDPVAEAAAADAEPEEGQADDDASDET